MVVPGAPQDEAGLTRKFETSHVDRATYRTPPIPRSGQARTRYRKWHLFIGQASAVPAAGDKWVGQ